MSLCSCVPAVRFDGMWRAGRKVGRGTYTLSNGGVYTGRFQDDVAAGTGTFSLPNPVEISSTEWMIPFNLQTEVPKIHLRAGFNKSGM